MDWIWILIALSIFLNMIALVLILQGKQRKDRDKANEVQAIQQSMERFVANMEKENEELYQQLAEYLKANQQSTDERIQLLEEKIRSLEEKLEEEAFSETMNEAFDDQEELNQPNLDLPQDEEKVLQLFKQGFSSNQIAKILQIDNGRIELIINLFKKRQSHSK